MSATQSPDPYSLLNVKEVAALLGCSTRHVRRLRKKGKMPKPLKLGQLVRWRRADIQKWIDEGCRTVYRYESRTPGVRR